MKRLVVSCWLLAVGVAMAAGMAFAADDVRNNWKSTETVGKYGYVESLGSYYPLDNGDDFDYCFRKDGKKGGDLVRKGYVIYLTENYTADNLVADADIMRIYLNGYNLSVNGNVKVSALTTDRRWDDAFVMDGGGGTISFPGSKSEAAFAVRYDGSRTDQGVNYYYVRNVTFSHCKGRVFAFNTYSPVFSAFSNVTFDQCSADRGSCIYVNSHHFQLNVSDCAFLSCSASDDGGAVYIDNIEPVYPKLAFSNCIIENCHADDGGGFMYINDGDAVVNGSGNTIISGCTAAYGGGVYANRLTTFDGFIFADNKSTYEGGGMHNDNTVNSSTISNCRFYRNAAGTSTSKYAGGGLYMRDGNGQVKGCRFLENTAYDDDGGVDYDVNATVSDCLVTGDFSKSTLNGDGTESNPYTIATADDWDVLYYTVKNGNTYENKPFIVLSSDILVANTIGGFNSNPDLKRPFKGTFDGNGHTITLYSMNGGSDKATFGCAQGATVRNLTVDGRIKGAYSLGGIFGNGSGSTASNCVNNATIIGTVHYIGGIAGWSGNGSKFFNCVNNGKVDGINCVGGIAGLSGNGSRFLNCLNSGEVAGAKDVGGIVGSEESAVSVENCHEFGSLNFPANGEFVIYTALDSTMCLDINGGANAKSNYDNLQLYKAAKSGAKTFTLTYDQSNGGYIIAAKQSGLVLTVGTSGEGRQDDVFQYQQYQQDQSWADRDRQLWEFLPADDGYYYIHSMCGDKAHAYLDVYGGNSANGANVGTYAFLGGDNQKFRLVRVGDAGGITGRSASGSTYELCLYNKDDCPADAHGIGVSHDALWGAATDTVNGEEFEMPDYVNDYIVANDKQKDGWLRVGYNRNGRPVFVPNGPTDELGYSVGRISETEYIFWKLGKLYWVKNGVSSNLNYTVVTNGTGSMGGGGWYVVEGVVERGKIDVNDAANLVLLRDSSLTVTGRYYSVFLDEYYEPGVSVPEGKTLNVFGVESGKLTARGCKYKAAGIGGGAGGSCGTVTINGGTVMAYGGENGAGIGGGAGGDGGEVTINGGSVTAYGGKGYPYIVGGACIGGGVGGASGSLKLGPRVIQFDDSHWGMSVTATFDNPPGLRLVSASVDFGGVKVTENGVNHSSICLSLGSCLTLTFGALNDFAVPRESEAEVTLGPISEDVVIGANQLPKVPMNDQLVVEYALPDGTIASATAYPIFSTNSPMTMAQAYYVVTGEVTTAAIDVRGEVNLILADNAKLTVNDGIRVDPGNAFAIYGQRTGSGTLTAFGGLRGAGIGGANPDNWEGCGDCGEVTINGGTVTATGGIGGGAGIGGGDGGNGGEVTINGGTVTATGHGQGWAGRMAYLSGGGAGIGGGGAGYVTGGAGGKVTITGGKVMAQGADGSAGIGGGGALSGDLPGAGGEIKITGGTVTAQGANGGAGIGGGVNEVGVKAGAGTVTIDGGSVQASSIQSQPTNSGGAAVYCVKVEGLEGFEILEGLDGYGVKDVCPIDNCLYLYLPDGDKIFFVNGVRYWAGVSGEGTVARVMHLLTVTEIDHLSLTVTVNDEVMKDFTGGEMLVPPNARVVVDYSPLEGWMLHPSHGTTHFEATVTDDLRLPAEGDEPIAVAPVSYVDRRLDGWDVVSAARATNAIPVTAVMTALADGWYYVSGTVSRGGIDVAAGCEANLILADGATLVVTGATGRAGIGVGKNAKLRVYAQGEGTGRLLATGGEGGAGIGGGRGRRSEGAGLDSDPGETAGEVTICGGVVTATGVRGGAGIGGGAGADGEDGIYAWTGGVPGGNGGTGGAGGTVVVLGGAVTAKSEDGADIGGGAGGSGGKGVYTSLEDGADGANGASGTVSLFGGIFGMDVEDGWIAECHEAIWNHDTATKDEYQWTVVLIPLICEGGEIAEDEEGMWIVTPANGETDVSIMGLPKSATVVVPPTVMRVYGVGDWQIRVHDGETDVTARYLIHWGEISPIRVFNDGHHYLLSEDGAYIDTGVPASKTLCAEMDFVPLEYTGKVSLGMDTHVANTSWRFFNYGNGDQGFIFDIAATRLGRKEGDKLTLGERYHVSVGCTNEWAYLAVTGKDVTRSYTNMVSGTLATGLNIQACASAMRLYSLRLYDMVNGEMALVRDFVPFQTKGAAGISGLYDRVTQKCFINDADDGSLTLEADEEADVLNYEGGAVFEDDRGAWIVMPDDDVTEVTITGLPEGESVAGVMLGDYIVPSAAFVGFGKGKTEGEFSLALNPEGVVTIGEKEIPVKPMIGEGCLVLGAGGVLGAGVSVSVKTIPGLVYELTRATALDAAFGSIGSGVKATGTGAPVTLTDDNPPADKAFYRVEVSAP